MGGRRSAKQDDHNHTWTSTVGLQHATNVTGGLDIADATTTASMRLTPTTVRALQRRAGNAAVRGLVAPAELPLQRYVYPDGAGRPLTKMQVGKLLVDAGVKIDSPEVEAALTKYVNSPTTTIKVSELITQLKAGRPGGASERAQPAPSGSASAGPNSGERASKSVLDETAEGSAPAPKKINEPPMAAAASEAPAAAALAVDAPAIPGTFFRVVPVHRIHVDDEHLLQSHLYEKNGLERSKEVALEKSIAQLSAGVKVADVDARKVNLRPFLKHQNSSANSPFVSGCPRLFPKQRAFVKKESPLLVFNLPADMFMVNPMGSGEEELLALHYIEKTYLLGVYNMKAGINREPALVSLDAFLADPARYY
jgi:hypothetical protein